MNARQWLMASRPKTLALAWTPILVGTALAFAVYGAVRIELSALAFLSAMLIQIGTNLINDALDFKKGADTPERLGPKRVTQSGLMDADRVLSLGLFCFGLSALVAIPLVMAGGWPLIAMGLCSFLAGYAYTGGPFPLAYRGLGDLFVLIFFGWVALCGVYYLNTGTWDWRAWVAGTQMGLLATIPIAINNMRDHATDRRVGKRTLAVRLGLSWVRLEIALLCFLPFLIGGFWYGEGFRWATFLPLFTFPLALFLFFKMVTTEPGVIYNRFLAWGVALDVFFGILLSLGFLI